jgi:hypothetical protein
MVRKSLNQPTVVSRRYFGGITIRQGCCHITHCQGNRLLYGASIRPGEYERPCRLHGATQDRARIQPWPSCSAVVVGGAGMSMRKIEKECRVLLSTLVLSSLDFLQPYLDRSLPLRRLEMEN